VTRAVRCILQTILNPQEVVSLRKLTILSIVWLLAPAFSAGALETSQHKHVPSHAQKARVIQHAIQRAGQPTTRLTVPADSYRA
jgi:hypothetical protein